MGQPVRMRMGSFVALMVAAVGVVPAAAGGQEKQALGPKPAQRVGLPGLPLRANAEAARSAAEFRVRAARAEEEEVARFLHQLEQQYSAQFCQLHKAELHFMRIVTNPTKQQFEKISAESQPGVAEALRLYVRALQGILTRETDLTTPITDAIDKSVRATLSPDQANAYHNELKFRVAARKEAGVLRLIAQIDEILLLSPDQRTKLREILTSQWNDTWNQRPFLAGDYLPTLPDTDVRAILSEDQRSIWRSVPKVSVRLGIDPAFARGIEIEDEVWPEDGAPKQPHDGHGKAASVDVSPRRSSANP